MNEYNATHPYSTLSYQEVTYINTPRPALASCKMKSTNSDHCSIKQQQHKLIDIYETSHGFEAPTRKNMNSPLAYYNKHGGKVDEEDDIDAEAEKFIQLKHKKFQLSKYSMSLSINEA